MPFTLSHAAAVLPALRRDGTGRGRLVPAVLVAGSFAPDMPFYAANVLPGGLEFGAGTHAFAGVFTVDVLISWALVGLWLLVREPLLALLPRGERGGRPCCCAAVRCATRACPCGHGGAVVRLRGAGCADPCGVGRVHASRAVGDRLVPAIGRDRVAGMPLFSWLQYGSSVLGAVLIAAFGVRALRRAPGGVPVGVPLPSVRDRWWAGAVPGGCAVAGAVQRAARRQVLMGHRSAWERVPALCFGVGAGPAAGALLYAVGVRVWRRGPVRDGFGGLADPAAPADPGDPGGPAVPGGVVGAGRGRPVGR